MNLITIEKKIPSSDGVHLLRCVEYIPDTPPRAILQFVHGMQEYIGRYEPLMRFFCEQGFVCTGHDHLGHGQSVFDSSEYGFFAPEDGWKYLIEDTHRVTAQIARKRPSLPVILYAHSMGSFIARLAAAQFPLDYRAHIFCGTAGYQGAEFGVAALKALKKIKGERKHSDLLELIALGAYNKKFERTSKYDWIMSDRIKLAAYEKDPLCSFHFSLSAMEDLVKLVRLCNEESCFCGIPTETPVLLISGALDPVGEYGEGVRRVYDAFLKSGHRKTDICVYPEMRHEVHNEPERMKVFRDVLTFIGKAL